MRTWMPILMLVAGVLCGCTETPTVFADPAEGSRSAYYRVEFTLPDDVDTGDVEELALGGHRAYDLRHEGGQVVSGIVQGDLLGGPVDLWLADGGTEVTYEDVFTYLDPVDPVFDRMMALGASFSQGVQAAVPLEHGVTRSPPAVVARQAGAYLPLPQVVPELFPPMSVDDVGPPPDCEVPSAVSYLAWALVDTLAKMTDPDTNLFIRAINQNLGTDVPEADLGVIFAEDPYSPDALRAAGLDLDACVL